MYPFRYLYRAKFAAELLHAPLHTTRRKHRSYHPGELGKININSATADELSQLSGIGPTIAQRIVDYREENGDFETIYDLLDVSGIGKETMKSIGEYITTGG